MRRHTEAHAVQSDDIVTVFFIGREKFAPVIGFHIRVLDRRSPSEEGGIDEQLRSGDLEMLGLIGVPVLQNVFIRVAYGEYGAWAHSD